ncbi:MAG: hypothetical protein P1U42_11160 [Phycisphaerales bacterium]|nr:hypothetical protein [Phycisphaerales bacterium]
MHNSNIPDYAELPTTKRLIRSTVIAFISGVVILVVIVLPAEYGVDPTGIGSISGLKRMGEIKSSLQEELKADQTNQIEPESLRDQLLTAQEPNGDVESDMVFNEDIDRTDTMTVTLDPGKSTEIKLTMSEGSSVEFSWTSQGGDAFYDLHGDSIEINYHIYEKSTASSKQGTLVAAFSGNHGWYWKNRTTNPISITLTTNGDYEDMKEMN